MKRIFLTLSRMEQIAAGLTGLFVTIVIVLAIVTEGQVFTDAANAIRGIESKDARASRNVAINCQDKRNKPLPYCQNRSQQIESDWQGIVRNNEGKTNAFSLGRGK